VLAPARRATTLIQVPATSELAVGPCGLLDAGSAGCWKGTAQAARPRSALIVSSAESRPTVQPARIIHTRQRLGVSATDARGRNALRRGEVSHVVDKRFE